MLALEHLLTGTIRCPIGENFAVATYKGKLFTLSLKQIDSWDYMEMFHFNQSAIQLLHKISTYHVSALMLVVYYNGSTTGNHLCSHCFIIKITVDPKSTLES